MSGTQTLRPLYRCETCGREKRATVTPREHFVVDSIAWKHGRWCGPMVRVAEHDARLS